MAHSPHPAATPAESLLAAAARHAAHVTGTAADDVAPAGTAREVSELAKPAGRAATNPRPRRRQSK